MVLPRAVDDLMKDALLFHADTLVMLDIECPIYLRKNSMGNLRLSDFCYRVELMARLFTIPWGCQGLEQLIIEYRPTGKSITIPPERLEFESKAIRKDASPGKLQHHEYRNDGQGWFLKPGLDQERFLDALEDGDWKRSIFKHMFKTSGIRKAKYIRINQTEFFAREQFFSNMMAGRKEMVEEEPAVNVRNMPTGCGDTGRIGRGVASVMSTLRSIVTG
ncbi:hypothetical protein BGX31_007647 [Mortierella sp. GBA43]|nr:hypothetical protein BGX31_007647 [Mortierella sp. GBA43]